jgi:hypothetical protein
VIDAQLDSVKGCLGASGTGGERLMVNGGSCGPSGRCLRAFESLSTTPTLLASVNHKQHYSDDERLLL